MTERGLRLGDVRVTYPGPPPVHAVDGVSIAVAPDECLGIIGESGSGKSTLARAMLGLLTEADVEGDLRLDDTDLGSLDEDGWRAVRWRRMALTFQSATALNPVLTVGDQVAEPLRVHLGLRDREASTRAGAVLADVGLGEWAAARHPGELSGGQRRLALVAVAVACDPEVLVLDEPTAGLDPVTREVLLRFLRRFRQTGGKVVVVLSHDVEAVGALAERVAVLYRGWLAEIGPAEAVLGDPRSPYGRALLDARPTLATVKELRGIRGDPPDPTELAEGCPFLGRCTQSVPECAPSRPPLLAPDGEDGRRVVACIRGGVVTLLAARDLHKTWWPRVGVLRREPVPAVRGVSVEVRDREVVGVAGSTGAGKSTLARLLVRLEAPDRGAVTFEGRDLLAARGRELKALRRRVQLLFQDPYEALSPQLTVGGAVREPLDAQDVGDPSTRAAVVRRSLAEASLPVDDAFLDRRAHELSGGQLQRVALARALVLEPKLLVADEPVSMLDASEQTKMLQLLKSLQVERGMAMILISHDLAVLLRVADRVLVMSEGRIVEQAAGTALLLSPRQAVSRSLLAASGWPLAREWEDGAAAHDAEAQPSRHPRQEGAR
ncbi:MAG TPA: ABC transporter ATP-binding protein [Acidimicrobiales bacterium]|nr:ABC transporter ATP-binding protein [Acidimicrobiales bacterium]